MRLTTKSIMLASLLLGLPLAANADTVRLTSLEWPPYTGEAVPQQGASMAVVEAAFEAMGYELEVSFYPWQRAVDQASDNPDYAGYFPEYYASSVEEDFIFSDPIGTGPLGFVEHVDEPVAWESLDDLEGKVIGTVAGYVNTDDFDARVEDGRIEADEVTSDETNVRKVAGKRIPMAVIDENVLDYLLANDPDLSDARDQVQFNDKLLEDKELFVAFAQDGHGEEMAEVLNEGLQKIDIDEIMKEVFEQAQ